MRTPSGNNMTHASEKAIQYIYNLQDDAVGFSFGAPVLMLTVSVSSIMSAMSRMFRLILFCDGRAHTGVGECAVYVELCAVRSGASAVRSHW